MRFIRWFAAIGLASAGLAQTSPSPKGPLDQLIPWLLDEDQQLRGVPFSELIFDTTGKKGAAVCDEQRCGSACRESDQRRVR
jgi:hypothetical protein